MCSNCNITMECIYTNALIYTLPQKQSMLLCSLYAPWLKTSCVSFLWMFAGGEKDKWVPRQLWKSLQICFGRYRYSLSNPLDKLALWTRSHQSHMFDQRQSTKANRETIPRQRFNTGSDFKVLNSIFLFLLLQVCFQFCPAQVKQALELRSSDTTCIA